VPVKAAADDVGVILDITPGIPHVFHAFAALLDEGDAALNRAARFIQDNTAPASPPNSTACMAPRWSTRRRSLGSPRPRAPS
jgi:hypothetical protein